MDRISLKYFSRELLVILPLVLLMAGCGPSQQEIMARSKLENAKTTYNEASANPSVSTNAPVALLDAQKEIKAAENASNYVEMEHRAYLAERKTKTAVAIAEKKVAENEIEKLSRESSAVLLAKRERELKAAQSQSEAKSLEMERLRMDVEQRNRELEKARQEAKAMAGESEQARQLAETKVREAEQAKLLAESRAQEVEQARLLAEASQREAEAKNLEAEKSKAESELLLKELSELKAKQTERGIVLTVGDVLFETGKSKLSPRAEQSVVKLADFLKKHSKRNILIEGHTDSVGSEAYNLNLSEKRADSVRSNLLAKDISPERITSKGYGEQYPVATNSTKLGRQLNRRVEVIILNEGVNPESAIR